MSTTLLTQKKIFGLFELDTAGTVLYSRPETEGGAGGGGAEHLTGRNFYDEVAPFGNVAEFRQRVGDFARGPNPADNFEFTCDYENGPTAVKVLLARVRSRLENSRTKTILMHIRKV